MTSNGFYRGGVIRTVFPDGLELVPNTNQLWEIDMAYGEWKTIEDRQDLIERSAFFARVNSEETYHYKICAASPLQVDKKSSLRRQTFFNVNQFKTGYATQGLFPYRGKFHPQLIKAIMNVTKLRKGDTVLDPMAGSGTVSIEAAMNGIHSIAVDVSPFCALMTRAKTQALSVDAADLERALAESAEFVQSNHRHRQPFQGGLFDFDVPRVGREEQTKTFVESVEDSPFRDILLLCYLDAMGYAARRVAKTAKELYPVIAERYLAAIQQFQAVREELELSIGNVDVRTADARRLEISDESVDGVITSPPYSFAIDYAENDRPQLEYLGYSTDELKQQMVGLTGGKKVENRVKEYFKDMKTIFEEMSRVLKPGKCCVVVIGSNEKQTGGIRHEVELQKYGEEVGFKLFWNMVRPIEGIRNSMRDEYVMFFQKQ